MFANCFSTATSLGQTALHIWPGLVWGLLTLETAAMLNQPNWDDDGDYPKRWTSSGLWASLRILLVGNWQFTQVQMLVSLPNPGTPLAGKEIEDIHREMLRGYLAQHPNA